MHRMTKILMGYDGLRFANPSYVYWIPFGDEN